MNLFFHTLVGRWVRGSQQSGLVKGVSCCCECPLQVWLEQSYVPSPRPHSTEQCSHALGFAGSKPSTQRFTHRKQLSLYCPVLATEHSLRPLSSCRVEQPVPLTPSASPTCLHATPHQQSFRNCSLQTDSSDSHWSLQSDKQQRGVLQDSGSARYCIPLYLLNLLILDLCEEASAGLRA